MGLCGPVMHARLKRLVFVMIQITKVVFELGK